MRMSIERGLSWNKVYRKEHSIIQNFGIYNVKDKKTRDYSNDVKYNQPDYVE